MQTEGSWVESPQKHSWQNEEGDINMGRLREILNKGRAGLYGYVN